MKLQKAKLLDGRVAWMVLNDDYLPIEPIQKYLRYLDNLSRSPNTIQSYARDLKLYWEFLLNSNLDWHSVTIENLADFINRLRNPRPGVISLQPQESSRSEKTINRALTCVCGFYEFHERIGSSSGVKAYRYQFQPGRKYKPFLQGIAKTKEVKTKLLKVKEPSTLPRCLTTDEVRKLINGCNNKRDKFLICLLYETGMRIGEALGLRHGDIHSAGENSIEVVHRHDNFNEARAKSGDRLIHVSKDLMKLYSDYLIEEYPSDIDSDYVFVNCWKGRPGYPMTRANVNTLFRRLFLKTGIKASPHLFRHTHATELIRVGWDMSHVQKRLGHANIQTTINTYVHLTDADLKEEYQKYWQRKEKK